MVGVGVVALLAQVGWVTLNFSALPMWVDKHLHEGKHLGLILGAFMVTEAVFRPSLGALSDRIGRKPLMLAGPAIGVFTGIATVGVWNPYLILALRAVDGVGLAAFWPASFAAIGDAVEEEYRSTAMAVLNSTMMAGTALGMLLGGIANDATRNLVGEYAGAFYFVSFVFLVTLVAGMIIFPRETHRHGHPTHAEPGHVPGRAELLSVVKLVPDMIVLSVIMFVAIGLLMPIVKLYSVDQLRMSETQFGAMVAPVAAVLGLLAVPFGRLGDRWGKMVSVCYGLLICAVSMWLIAIVKSMWVMAGSSALLGVGFALAFPAWMAVVSQAAPPARRGQVMGAVGLAQGVGALIGVGLGPLIYASDRVSLPRLGVDHFNLPFWLCAVLLSASTVMAFTWIAPLRAGQSGGRRITVREQRAIVAASIIAVAVVAGWVVLRYTRPVSANRVAWLWVQAVVRRDTERAQLYTLPSFERAGVGGKTASEVASDIYAHRVNDLRARYRLVLVSQNKDRAQVRLTFRFPDGHRAGQVIGLVQQPSGEWKVAEQRAQ